MELATNRQTLPAALAGGGEVALIAQSSLDVVEQLSGMIEQLADTSLPIPRSEWTVGETGAHLAYAAIGFSLFARGLVYPHGDGTPQSLAEANEVGLMSFSERNGAKLAGHLREGTRNFLKEVAVRPPDQICYSPVGELPLGTLSAYFLAHNLMHGCAVTAALSRDFLFRPEYLAQAWPFFCYAFRGPLVQSAAFAGKNECVQFQIADAFDFALSFKDGGTSVDPVPSQPADCVIELDALHFFLIFIKLLSVREVVNLGRATISGADPDLAYRFMDYFYVP
ncbi:MAG: SCP2 sterol-binding domain-containing protein [Actinomycetota bacterium]